MRRAAEQAPLCLLLDDAHARDATTLDALELATLELATRRAEAPLWICVLAGRLRRAAAGAGASAPSAPR